MLFADMLVVRSSFDIPIRRIIPTYQETAIVAFASDRHICVSRRR